MRPPKGGISGFSLPSILTVIRLLARSLNAGAACASKGV